MNWIIDVALVTIVLIGLLMGYQRGFVKTVAKPVKLVSVWICSFKTCSFFAKIFVAPLVQPTVTAKLSEFLQENCEGLSSANVAEKLPTLLKMAAGIFNIDVSGITGSGAVLAEKLAEAFTEPLVSIFSVVITFILLLLIYSVLFTVLLWLLNLIFHLHPFAWLNRLLGVIFGTAFAIIIAWLLSMFLGYILSFSIFSSIGFEGGAIYRFFKAYHPLDLLLGF